MKGITILYVTMARVPGERAHSVQIARMCAALKEMGSDVILVTPKRGGKISRTATMAETIKYYGLKTSFKHFRVPVLGLLSRNARIEYFTWLISVFMLTFFALTFYVVHKILFRENVYIYMRETAVLILTQMIGWMLKPKIIYEVHEFFVSSSLGHRFFSSSLRRTYLIICIADVLSKLVRKQLGICNERIVTLHSGVDEEIFDIKCSYPDELALIKQRSRIIMYAGQLDDWKKPEFLIDMMEYIQEDSIALVFVGGKLEDILRLKQYGESKGLSDRLFFLGWRSPAQVPKYLALADVLVHYSPPGRALSPLKIFEYMLSGQPIVAPKAPGVEEVLKDGANALLFDPHDPADAARKVLLLLKDKELGERLSSSARNTALLKYTYRARARALLDLLSAKDRRKQ